MKKHKLPSAPNSILVFVPYRPPSRNRSDGRLRLNMLDKAAARAVWLSASSACAAELSTMITSMARANTSETPSPPVSTWTTVTKLSDGNTSNSQPTDAKAS